jgi:glycosyltransferase involved in cell wall biosynthesis
LGKIGKYDLQIILRGNRRLKVALIHDWLNGMRGGEKVLEALCELFPQADIFTLFYQPEKVSEKIRRHEVRSSFLNKLPGVNGSYRNFLPLFPKAIESFKFDEYDLCISISHSVAKGIYPGPNCLHICLCLTPMRYIWDRFEDYFAGSGALKRYLAERVSEKLRRWDVASSSRVDLYVAISDFVKWRIAKYYNRPSAVIYPFADTEYFKPEERVSPSAKDRGGYFLAVSAFVPYKKIGDIVIAFKGQNEKLIIVGDGPEREKLVEMASPNIEFTGWVSDEKLLGLYRGCKALIFPGVEDFGIVPVETQACGRPVIAYAEGGALETVKGLLIGEGNQNGKLATGLFFKKAGPDGIALAVGEFQTMEFDSKLIRENALRFSKPVFERAILDFVNESYSIFKTNGKAGLEKRMMDHFSCRV